jgi:hypothetical protein
VHRKNYAYTKLVGNIKGKKLLRRPRHRWEDNIKIDLTEIGFGVYTELM